MSSAARLATPPDELLAPSAERWHAMTVTERESWLDVVGAALAHQAELAGEGLPHSRAKSRIVDTLGHHFRRMGRKILIASELAVHYPLERIFVPDLLAVLDVEDRGDDETRRAWVVAEEGRGPDLVIEVLDGGDPEKDLVDNVLTYARLGIREYFVYDRRLRRVLGYRLPDSGVRRYQPVPNRSTRLYSRVLDLELGMLDGRLRFFAGDALLPSSQEVLDRANALLDDLELRAEADARALREAEQRVEEQRLRADAEAAARAEAERRADAEAAARAALEVEIAELKRRLGDG